MEQHAASAIRLAGKIEMLQRLREDLAGFDLDTLEGRAGLLGWWLAYCPDSLGGESPTDAESVALALSPISAAEATADLPLTHMMLGVWKGTQKFWTPHMTMNTSVSHLATVAHWYLYWPTLVPGFSLVNKTVEAFLATAINSSDPDLSIMPAEYLAWRQWYNASEIDWRKAQLRPDELRCWYFLSAAAEKNPHRCLLPRGLTLSELQTQIMRLAPAALSRNRWLAENIGVAAADLNMAIHEKLPLILARHAAKILDSVEACGPPLPGPTANTIRGANIVGYVTGELGIGEDARMTANALRHACYPFSMLNYPRQSATRQEDYSFARYLSWDNPHDQNIFCLPAVECMMARADLPAPFFAGRRNVGYMPWELERWPKAFLPVLDWLDEIWTISSFLVEGIRAVTTVPVFCMPPAVVAEAPGRKRRADFGLPTDDRFLFLFVFDFNSSFDRKNPEACLDAFQCAFSPANLKVGLVLKCMNRHHDEERFKHFVARCATDQRIVLFMDTMDRGDTLDLIACCDAFLSLHRAEGFGRGIAEAMALGKPVIATAYSGNLDFCLPETACLVDFTKVAIPPAQYWYSEGQFWAEPDVGAAAGWMRRLVEDTGLRLQIASAGQRFIRERHSPQAAAARYLARLLPKPKHTNAVI